MKTKYFDLIDQTFDFPQEEFTLKTNELQFHGIDLMALIKEHGAPLKFTYLPKISDNINRAKTWFAAAIKEHNYAGSYNYCYCTKSSHFKHVLDEALKNDIHIETSSAFDIDIVENLKAQGKINDDTFVICNGFKRDQYVQNIARLINNGHKNCITVIDNYEEITLLSDAIDGNYNIGIRIASEEEPKFEFYTSRLGLGYKNIVPFFNKEIKDNPKVTLKMLHFFINTGIRDTAYYWNELLKCMKVYIALKKVCPSLDSLNIGGGFPIKNSLAFDYDYAYMVSEIIGQIKQTCDEAGVAVPHIFTEFGSFTVGESGGAIYQVLYQKQQNDREKWNIINSSFITTIPDTWAINKRFVMLAINGWQKEYERVLLGGLTCDSDDYYNSEQHMNGIYLPKYNKDKPLYIGFFNTGAYQESIGGFGGLQHCLIPTPKHVLIDRDEDGKLVTSVFAEQQTSEQLLSILGYDYGVNDAFAKAESKNSLTNQRNSKLTQVTKLKQITMKSQKTYAGIDEKYASSESSKIVLIPVPYDGTSTWGKGADKGPEAFLHASENMELYDIETDTEVYKQGVFLAEALTGHNTPEEMVAEVHKEVKAAILRNKFVTMMGGEHSVSIGSIRAFNECYNDLTVLQLDAHTDLRKEYEGSVYNHACAMYEANETTNLVQVGIRSMDASEKTVLNEENVFYAHDMSTDDYWMDNAIELMTDNVYITLDLDALDPSIMPSTGTPEPGGLLWYETLEFLRKVFEEKNVVGFDIVELCPNPSEKSSDFLAAKLYYKMLSYKFMEHDADEDNDNLYAKNQNTITKLKYDQDED